MSSGGDTEPFQDGSNTGSSGNVGESGFRQWLNTTSDSGQWTIVNVANPLNWGAFATAFLSSLIAGAVLSIQYTINGVVDAVTTLFGGATSWLAAPGEVFRFPGGKRELSGGLISTVQLGIEGIIDAAWAPLEGLGWLAYPIAVAEVLLILYIVNYSVAYAREEVL